MLPDNPSDTNNLKYCSLKPIQPRSFDHNVNSDRAEIIISNSKYWINGTTLKYYFLDSDGFTSDVSNGQEIDLVNEAFNIWKETGIGINFVQTSSPQSAIIRIAFQRGKGSWSYIGRDCLNIPTSSPTMNFGWNLLEDPRTIGVALHEIGHAIGFPHEHQNPNTGIIWNEQSVIEYFSGPPNNWSLETIKTNILNKIPPDQVKGSTWDPSSIMEYEFDASMIKGPQPFNSVGIHPQGNALSDTDKNWVIKFYPPLSGSDYKPLKIAQSMPVDAQHGEQLDFYYIPNSTRNYEVRLFGQCDAVLVIFEDRGESDNHFIVGQDDSGTDNNVYINIRLEREKKYLIKVKILYRNPDVIPSIMLW